MKKPLVILCCLLIPITLIAQIEFPGTPASKGRQLKSAPAKVILAGLTPAKQASYLSSLQGSLKTMAFAYPFDTVLNVISQGSWETIEEGMRICRLSIVSPGARSLNLIFSRFILPVNAKVFIYTPDYSMVKGAFTEQNRPLDGELATAPLPGQHITIELNLPADEQFLPELVISRVSHDFKGVFGDLDSKGSGDCNIDINCPAGASWQTEKRSVVKFIRGGVWLCSGSLINNTRNDGRPLFFTANHTIGSESQARQTVFFFKFEKPSCGSGTATYLTMSGSRLLATTSKLDFCLVELSSPPPSNYEPYYAGWDRNVYSYLDTVTCIHHPNGDSKKISKSFHRVVTADFGGGYDTNTHWKVAVWDLGTTEPGSSGSPLFNTDHRIVGDLTGGDASCSYNFNDYFQKFSVSWDKYPDSTNQLKYWLDPDGKGLLVVNGYDPYSGNKPIAGFSIRPSVIQAGKIVYFTDMSSGQPTFWSWTFEGGNPARSESRFPAGVCFDKPGTYHVKLLVSNELGVDSLVQAITVAHSPSYALSENRVVIERLVNLNDTSKDTPSAVSWSVPGAKQSIFAGSNFEFYFTTPGEYTVNQITGYQDFNDTLTHYNQILVVPDALTFRSRSFSNILKEEHSVYQNQNAHGYLPGSNNQGIDTYAELFHPPTDSLFLIRGITIPVGLRSQWAKDYYLQIVVWDTNRVEKMKDSILVSGFRSETKFTKWLRNPIAFDQPLYVGFRVKPWADGTFVSKMAEDRGEKGLSTSYVIKNGEWIAVSEYNGLHTSWDFTLEATVDLEAFKDEIKIVPSSMDGQITIDMGNLVFSRAEVALFNLSMQRISADYYVTGNAVVINQLPKNAAPGVYMVRLTVDRIRVYNLLVNIQK